MRSILPLFTKTLLVALLAANGVAAWASQNAVTDNGSVVLLNDDGTWRYISNEGEKASVTISFNKGLVSKIREPDLPAQERQEPLRDLARPQEMALPEAGYRRQPCRVSISAEVW